MVELLTNEQKYQKEKDRRDYRTHDDPDVKSIIALFRQYIVDHKMNDTDLGDDRQIQPRIEAGLKAVKEAQLDVEPPQPES